MAKNGCSRAENVEIDTESIKIDEELANLWSKLSLKLAKNWVQGDFACRDSSSNDFIDLQVAQVVHLRTVKSRRH